MYVHNIKCEIDYSLFYLTIYKSKKIVNKGNNIIIARLRPISTTYCCLLVNRSSFSSKGSSNEFLFAIFSASFLTEAIFPPFHLVEIKRGYWKVKTKYERK
jgi:hypothetical protein